MPEKYYILWFDHPNNIKCLRLYYLTVVALRATAKESFFTLKIESGAHSFETSVTTYQSTCRHIQEDGIYNVHSLCREILEFRIFIFFFFEVIYRLSFIIHNPDVRSEPLWQSVFTLCALRMWCNVVWQAGTNISEKSTASLYYEEVGSRFHRNSDTHLPDYNVSVPENSNLNT
jgi:hypothetical protein